MSERTAPVDGPRRIVEQLVAGDPRATRLIYAIVIALVVVGAVLVLLAIWMIRRTRADPELLAPLERMSESKWRKGDPDTRRALLDEVRPAGAAVPSSPELDHLPLDHLPADHLPTATELPPPIVGPALGPVVSNLAAEPLVEPLADPEEATIVEPLDEPRIDPETVPLDESETTVQPEEDVPDVDAATQVAASEGPATEQ